jgi:hypothetical protein
MAPALANEMKWRNLSLGLASSALAALNMAQAIESI